MTDNEELAPAEEEREREEKIEFNGLLTFPDALRDKENWTILGKPGNKIDARTIPEILEEQDRVITRIGNSEVIQTRESITIQERCTIRPHSVPTGD